MGGVTSRSRSRSRPALYSAALSDEGGGLMRRDAREEEKMYRMHSHRKLTVERRVATIFAAGAGLPAILGLMHGVILKELQRGIHLQYVELSGVSAGALVTAFLSYVDILDPFEMLEELSHLMKISVAFLTTQPKPFSKHFCRLLCWHSYSSIAEWDKFVEFLSTSVNRRRQEVLEKHRKKRERGQRVQYALCRVTFTDGDRINGPITMYFNQGGCYGGTTWDVFFRACIASAAIPVLFPAQRIGNISRRAMDGALSTYCCPTNTELKHMLQPEFQPVGGDAFCANASEVHRHTADNIPPGMDMAKIAAVSWAVWVINRCNADIDHLRSEWKHVYSGHPRPCRIWRCNGTLPSENKPDPTEISVQQCKGYYTRAQNWVDEQFEAVNREAEGRSHPTSNCVARFPRNMRLVL
jgi:hypothetical protein